MEALTLETFLIGNVMAFLLCFARIGAALFIMPGIGDSMTPQQIRLYIALALSLVLSPLVASNLPVPLPTGPALFLLIVMEVLIGVFIGTVMRILMLALETAGMIISMMSGLGNAQLFNPSMATQGSLVGAFLSIMRRWKQDPEWQSQEFAPLRDFAQDELYRRGSS